MYWLNLQVGAYIRTLYESKVYARTIHIHVDSSFPEQIFELRLLVEVILMEIPGPIVSGIGIQH